MKDKNQTLTWKDFFVFYKERINLPTPITDSYVLDPKYDYQQQDGGYIKNAIKCGVINKKATREERNKISQQWHFFVSFLFEDFIKDNNNKEKLLLLDQQAQIKFAIETMNSNNEQIRNTRSQFLPCPELAIWMAEAAGVFENDDFKKDKELLSRMLEAVKNKKNQGIHSNTIWNEVNKEIFNEEEYIWNEIEKVIIANKIKSNKS